MTHRPQQTPAAPAHRRLARALAFGMMLSAFFAPDPTRAAGRLAAGVERLTFRDQTLSQVYGSRFGVTVAGDLLSRSWWDLTLRASYVAGANDPPHLAFIGSARTEMQVAPVRLQARLRHRLGPALEAWAGPETAWVWFRETWEAEVPGAGVSARRTDSGSWFGLGGIAGLRVRAGRVGHLRASVEWVWCAAEREATPGNSHQSGSMDGGWSGISLLWEPPWVAF
jgi:hypothetical protein